MKEYPQAGEPLIVLKGIDMKVEKGEFANLEIIESTTFMKISGSEEYIGAVDRDSPIPFDLEFEVMTGTSPDVYDLTLNVKYTDDLNQEHEEQIDVPMAVREAQSMVESSGSGGGFWVWLRRLLGLGP